jgi:hypothetical protein
MKKKKKEVVSQHLFLVNQKNELMDNYSLIFLVPELS